ncbi:hypothetical protein IE53DRAFT_316218 [Violaceomyces palustris]|uniref:Uncharacterized protein n=1 Tax=Violaceomyces palustris TaxID=1673888 RepID=A0ACD0NWU4_9BASI|nr:hypothetical protein IE53DRAFT_316218 [Violaceomyces palustris]
MGILSAIGSRVASSGLLNSKRTEDYTPLPTTIHSPTLSVSSLGSEGVRYHALPKKLTVRNKVRSLTHHLPTLKLTLLLLGCFILGKFASFPSSDPASFTSTFLVADDKYHRIFQDKSPGRASQEAMRIRAYDAMSDDCVQEWVIHHIWGESCQGTDLSDGLSLDGVWAWVNGSDPVQMASRQAFRPSTKLNMDVTHRYADHNELLYSMRSAFESLGPKVMRKMHILASAYPLGDSAVGEPGTKMVGQIPAWLKKESTVDKNGYVALHHDSEYFRPSSVDTKTQGQIQEWRSKVLPSFNSLAVESQLSNLEATASDQMVYFNDDFFTLRPNSISDFTSPLYGPVIKTLARVTSYYTPSKDPLQRLWNPAGEEVGIKRAAWVLGQRFPMRTLPYITHHPRSLWLPLLREAMQTFPQAFQDTALARFRAQKEVPNSIQGFFLASWYIVERHREALLWSWAVAKWGTEGGGVVSPKIKDEMWVELVGSQRDSIGSDTLKVKAPLRKSVEDPIAFQKAGVDVPLNTEYSFSSKDGHALSYLSWLWYWNRPRHGFPDLTKGLIEIPAAETIDPSFHPSSSSRSTDVCKLKRTACLGPREESESASSLFKRIAFEKPECGDCMIAALMGASGISGIEKFVPPPLDEEDVVISSTSRAESPSAGGETPPPPPPPPHLPLTSSWKETDFSLETILSPSWSKTTKTKKNLRIWCARLIQRYSYVMGSTPSDFYKVERADSLEEKLGRVDDSSETLMDRFTTGPTTFLCLNDDIKEDLKGTERINRILQNWFNDRWPRKLPDEI